MDSYREIENLIYRYAEHIDAGDLEGAAELFRHGAILSPAHNSRVEGYDKVLALYRAACRIYPDSGTPKTRHLTTNVLIEVEGDEALARSTYTVLQCTESFPLQPVITGRYHDTFARREGRWHFSERAMYLDFIGDWTAHMLYDPNSLSSG
jgi:3-phenylpropionate/cinnamic acid dioxygenase small subunit